MKEIIQLYHIIRFTTFPKLIPTEQYTPVWVLLQRYSEIIMIDVFSYNSKLEMRILNYQSTLLILATRISVLAAWGKRQVKES